MLQPNSCDSYPTVSKQKFNVAATQYLGGDIGKEIVVFCGSSGGRHMTLKVFFEGVEGLRMASLDFNDTRPNLTIFDNYYKSVLYKRLFFDDIGYSDIPYIYVYKLYLDSSTFGFSVVFGESGEKNYIDYYKSLLLQLNKQNAPVYSGPILAALFATKNHDYICQQYYEIERKVGVLDFDQWKFRLLVAGFPMFNIKNNCRSK